MNFLGNFGIAKRLYLVSFALIAALSLLAVSAWSQLNEVTNLADQTGSSRVPQLERMADVELNVTRVSLQLRHAMLVTTPADLASTLAYIGDKRKHIDETLSAFGEANFTPQGKEAFAKIEPLAKDF